MIDTLERKDEKDIEHTMFLRPRNPDDHRQFEKILPQMTPLFVYEMDGEDWVRWAIPIEVAKAMGWGDMKCKCCEESEVVGTESSFHVDTNYQEIAWFLDPGHTPTPKGGDDEADDIGMAIEDVYHACVEHFVDIVILAREDDKDEDGLLDEFVAAIPDKIGLLKVMFTAAVFELARIKQSKEEAANAVRDMIIAAIPGAEDAVRVRDEVATKWCEEHGIGKDDLTMEQILEIRALPEWQNAGKTSQHEAE